MEVLMTPKHKCKSILGNNHKRSNQHHRTSFLPLGKSPSCSKLMKQSQAVWLGLVSFCFSLTEYKVCMGQHRYSKSMLDSNYTTNTSGMLFKDTSQIKCQHARLYEGNQIDPCLQMPHPASRKVISIMGSGHQPGYYTPKRNLFTYFLQGFPSVENFSL